MTDQSTAREESTQRGDGTETCVPCGRPLGDDAPADECVRCASLIAAREAARSDGYTDTLAADPEGPVMIENTSKRDLRTHGLGALIEGQSGYIAGMEAAGQQQLVHSDLLPTEMSPADGSAWTALGFTFGDVVKDDPLFRHATLPKGWTRQGSEHAMHSTLVDERGLERVGVFYKAAFYDRRADMHIINVGDALATKAIYGDGEPTIPWDLLTAGERDAAILAIDNYRALAEAHPSIYGGRADRARTLRTAVRS